MARYIYCRKCGDGWKIHPGDSQMGFTSRKVYLSCVLPEGHGIRVNGEFTPLSDVICDKCDSKVTGDIVVAISMWRHEDHTCEMAPWEHEYGNVLTKEAVAVHDKATGKEAVK